MFDLQLLRQWLFPAEHPFQGQYLSFVFLGFQGMRPVQERFTFVNSVFASATQAISVITISINLTGKFVRHPQGVYSTIGTNGKFIELIAEF